jgi:hypothetical protein
MFYYVEKLVGEDAIIGAVSGAAGGAAGYCAWRDYKKRVMRMAFVNCSLFFVNY